jgi:hypothetical protein
MLDRQHGDRSFSWKSRFAMRDPNLGESFKRRFLRLARLNNFHQPEPTVWHLLLRSSLPVRLRERLAARLLTLTTTTSQRTSRPHHE